MMLKTSSRKFNPFYNMIGFTLQKNLGIVIILCILSLLYCPGTFIANRDYIHNGFYNTYLLENFAATVSVIAAAVSVFFNVINFSFLYKKSSSDVFHAFPLTRRELLLSRLFASLICTLIPVAVCYISYGILASAFPVFGSIAQLLWYLLHTVVVVLVCSTFSLVFIISAGSMFDLGVSLIGANVALLIVGWMFNTILQETLFGYDNYSISDIMYSLSPPYFCGMGIDYAADVTEKGISTQSIEFLIRSVLYIIIFTVISVLLYNKRKAEKGGTAYAYNFMYLICSVLAGMCGGYLLGYLFTYDISSPVFYVFVTVGAILTTVIYGVVTNRGFKKVSHAILTGAISSALIISVAIIGITGGFGYSKRIPKKENIKSANVRIFDEYINFVDCQDILLLHKKLVEPNTSNETNGNILNIRFDYNLKNGRTMSRQFSVDSSVAEKELLSVYKSENRLKAINDELRIDTASLISLYFYQDGEFIQADISQAEAKEFLDAYWLDVQNCGNEVLEESYYDVDILEISGYSKSEDRYFSYRLASGYDSFVNTHQFVTEKDLIARAQTQDTSNAKY